MMYSICYVSDERKELKKEDLILLYEQTVQNNNKEQITGVLIHKDGSFFQVLEGDKNVITTLFKKIKKDRRHKNVITLFTRESIRVFENYQTGFSIVHDYNGLESMRVFLADNRAISTTSACVESIIKTFLKA